MTPQIVKAGAGAVFLLIVLAMPRPWRAWTWVEGASAAAAVALGTVLAFVLWRQWQYTRRYRQAVAKREFRTLVEASQTGFAKLSAAARTQRQEARKAALMMRLRGIVQSLRQTIGAHAAVLYLRDDDGSLRFFCADASDAPGFVPVLPANDSGVLRWVLRHAEPFSLLELGKPVSGLTYYNAEQNIRSFLAVPVLRQESCEGVLAIDSREVQAFSEEEYRHILETMAIQIVHWLEYHSEQAQTGEELEHWRAFFDAAQQLQAANDMQSAVDMAIDLVDTVVRADLIAICEAVPDRDRFVVLGWRGEPILPDRRIEFGPEDSWAGWALQQTTPQGVKDFAKRDRNIKVICSDEEIPGQGSTLCIPFDIDKETEAVGGGLILWSHRSEEFGTNDADILSRLMSPFALAFSRARAMERLQLLATRDALTGLYNRRVAQETLETELRRAARSGENVGVILLDVDHFKKFNDTYGHDAGDEVLRSVATVLSHAVRDVDLPARFGGEEFLVVLPGADRKDAERVAERIRKQLRQTKVRIVDGRNLSVTASFGAATFTPDTAETLDQLLKRADEALYLAKEQGRDRVVVSKFFEFESTAVH